MTKRFLYIFIPCLMLILITSFAHAELRKFDPFELVEKELKTVNETVAAGIESGQVNVSDDIPNQNANTASVESNGDPKSLSEMSSTNVKKTQSSNSPTKTNAMVDVESLTEPAVKSMDPKDFEQKDNTVDLSSIDKPLESIPEVSIKEDIEALSDKSLGLSQEDQLLDSVDLGGLDGTSLPDHQGFSSVNQNTFQQSENLTTQTNLNRSISSGLNGLNKSAGSNPVSNINLKSATQATNSLFK